MDLMREKARCAFLLLPHLAIATAILTSAVGCRTSEWVGMNDGFRVSPREQASMVERAENGDGEAAATLAWHHLMYDGERETGLRWLEKAAQAGHAQSQYNLGQICAGMDDEGEVKRGALWLLESAKNGLPDAMIAVGLLFAEGKGVPLDKSRAEAWLERGVAEGPCFRPFGQGEQPWDSFLSGLFEARESLARIYVEDGEDRENRIRAYVHALLAEKMSRPGLACTERVRALREQIEGRLDVDDMNEARKRLPATLRSESVKGDQSPRR